MRKVLSIFLFSFYFGAKKVISTRHKINRPSSSYQYWWHWWSTEIHLQTKLSAYLLRTQEEKKEPNVFHQLQESRITTTKNECIPVWPRLSKF